MKAYCWEGWGDYQYILFCSGAETVHFVNTLGPYAAKAVYMGDEFFFLLSTDRHAIAPLPTLAIAFGGMHDEIPIGREVAVDEVLPDLRVFHLESFREGASLQKDQS